MRIAELTAQRVYCIPWRAPTARPSLAPRRRGVFDFLPLAATGWSVPGSQKKWSSRVKCNTYYYRTDYLIGFFVIELAALLTKPSTLFSLGWCTCESQIL